MKRLYAALLGLAVAGLPAGAGGQVVGAQTKAAPNEEQHIALTQQYRMMQTFARRIEMAAAGEEEDVRTNGQKLVNAVANASAGIDALAKVTDSTQVASIQQLRALQATAKTAVDSLEAELNKTPLSLRAVKTHAIAVREAAEKAEEAHGKMLAPAAPAKPEVKP